MEGFERLKNGEVDEYTSNASSSEFFYSNDNLNKQQQLKKIDLERSRLKPKKLTKASKLKN
jgi:hypothetical protein